MSNININILKDSLEASIWAYKLEKLTPNEVSELKEHFGADAWDRKLKDYCKAGFELAKTIDSIMIAKTIDSIMIAKTIDSIMMSLLDGSKDLDEKELTQIFSDVPYDGPIEDPH